MANLKSSIHVQQLDVNSFDELYNSEEVKSIFDYYAPSELKRALKISKDISEFDYLEIEPPLWSIITCWVLSLIATIGLWLWIVNNEFESDGTNYNKFNRKRNYY